MEGAEEPLRWWEEVLSGGILLWRGLGGSVKSGGWLVDGGWGEGGCTGGVEFEVLLEVGVAEVALGRGGLVSGVQVDWRWLWGQTSASTSTTTS